MGLTKKLAEDVELNSVSKRTTKKIKNIPGRKIPAVAIRPPITNPTKPKSRMESAPM